MGRSSVGVHTVERGRARSLGNSSQMQPRHEDASAGGTWRSLPGVVASSALLELDACRGVTWKRGVEGRAAGVGHVLCPETGRKSRRVGMFGPLEDRLTLALSVVGGACRGSAGGSGRRSGNGGRGRSDCSSAPCWQLPDGATLSSPFPRLCLKGFFRNAFD